MLKRKRVVADMPCAETWLHELQLRDGITAKNLSAVCKQFSFPVGTGGAGGGTRTLFHHIMNAVAALSTDVLTAPVATRILLKAARLAETSGICDQQQVLASGADQRSWMAKLRQNVGAPDTLTYVWALSRITGVSYFKLELIRVMSLRDQFGTLQLRYVTPDNTDLACWSCTQCMWVSDDDRFRVAPILLAPVTILTPGKDQQTRIKLLKQCLQHVSSLVDLVLGYLADLSFDDAETYIASMNWRALAGCATPVASLQ